MGANALMLLNQDQDQLANLSKAFCSSFLKKNCQVWTIKQALSRPLLVVREDGIQICFVACLNGIYELFFTGIFRFQQKDKKWPNIYIAS